ncbi:hypothetical protein [Rhizobium laguerreae]|nr:hypothetical protein [Rhizobium laguerreae]MBY3488083.1 hypothetical protein [Rhizobium laguerreae]
MIGYFEHTGTGMDGMLDELERRGAEHGYVYGVHNMPHDIKVREWTRGGMTRIEVMLREVKARGLGTVRKIERAYVHDRINGTRRILAKIEFDQAGCIQGIKCLRNYRKDWDEDLSVFRDAPLHNWASHGADAFGGLAIIFTGLAPEPLKPHPVLRIMFLIEKIPRLAAPLGMDTLGEHFDVDVIGAGEATWALVLGRPSFGVEEITTLMEEHIDHGPAILKQWIELRARLTPFNRGTTDLTRFLDE